MASEQLKLAAKADLSGLMSVGATALTAMASVAWPTVGQFRVQADREIMILAGGAGRTYTIPARGAEGTTAQIHNPHEALRHLLTPQSALNLTGGVNAQTDTTYTVATTDARSLVTLSNALAIAVTLPQATSGDVSDFGPKWWTVLDCIGAGTVTITPTTSTINGAPDLVLTTGQWAFIFADGANYRAIVAADASTLSNAVSILSQAVSVLSQNISVLSQQVSTLSQNVSVVSNAVSNALSVGNAASNAASVVSQALSSQAAALSIRIDTQSQLVSVLSQQVSALSQTVSVLSNAASNALSVANAASNAASVVSNALSNEISNRGSAINAVSTVASNATSIANATSNAASVVSQALSVTNVSLSNLTSAHNSLSNTVSGLTVAGLMLSLQNVDALAVSAGAPVYAFTSANTFKRADCDAASDVRDVLGLVVDANVAVSAVGRVQTGGKVTLTTGEWDSITGQVGGLTAGSKYYLGTTAGTLTTTAPTAGDVRPVGIALSTTEFHLMLALVPDWVSALSTISTAASNALSVADAASNAASVVSNALSVLSQSVSTQAAALSVRIDTQSQSISVLSQQVSALSQAHSALSQVVSALSNAASNALSVANAASQAASVVSTAASNALSVANAASNAASNALSVANTASNAASVVSQALSSQAAALSVRIDTQIQSVSVLSQQVSVLSQAHSALSQAVSLISAIGPLLSLQNVDASAVSAGCPVYAFTSADTFKRANAGAAATKNVLGLVADSAIAVSALGRIQVYGRLTLTTGQWDSITGQVGGLTAGSKYYLDASVGLLTTTAGIRPVGVALSTTEMEIFPLLVDDDTSAISAVSTAASNALSVANAASNATSVVSQALSNEISNRNSAVSVLSQQVSVLSNKTSDLVSAAAVLTDNAIVRGDGGVRGVQSSGVLIDDLDNVTVPGTIASDTDVTDDLGSASVRWSTVHAWDVKAYGDLFIPDVDLSHFLIIRCLSNLTANRIFYIDPGDNSYSLTIGSNSSISGTAYVVGGTDVAVADGGTGSSTATGARTNLGFDGSFTVCATSGTTMIVGGGATASEVRWLEPSGGGTAYVGFKSPALAGNTVYDWPNAFPAVTGYVLSCTDAGVMSWAAQSGSLDINGLTAADPALADEVPIYDTSASANRKVTIQEIAGFCSVGVSEFRLTLTTGTPVTTADVTAAGTIYLTPYIGNRIRIYDGTRWNLYQNAEISLGLTLTSGKNYDVFVYDNAGTLTLELSAAWTNDTTRADALTTQDGVNVKSGATTRLYLGTIRASGTNTTEDSYGGGSQSGGKRFVWNAYNRVDRHLGVKDTTDNWSYNTATWRQGNAASGNKVEYVAGLSQDVVHANAQTYTLPTGAGNTGQASIGVGVDATNANSALTLGGKGISAAAYGQPTCTYHGYPGVGYHYLAWVEIASGTGTSTIWYGDDGKSFVQGGLQAVVKG